MKRAFKLKTLAALAGAAAAVIGASPASAQGLRIIPQNYCYVSSPSAATTLLAGFTCDKALTTALLGSYQYAVICAYTQGFVWKDNGQVPTGTPGSGGTGVASGQCFGYNGNFQAIQFIQQTSGAIISVALYK